MTSKRNAALRQCEMSLGERLDLALEQSFAASDPVPFSIARNITPTGPRFAWSEDRLRRGGAE